MSELLNLPKGKNLLSPENIGQYFNVVNPEGIEMVVVDIGQPRIASTARAALAASLNSFSEVHFQPWKYIQRYAVPLERNGLNPRVIINKKGEKSARILLKETPGGPNDPKENFDPVAILLEKGLKPEQIRVMLGIREPFVQFASWIKFDQSRRPEIFLEGQKYLLSLLDIYNAQRILYVPFVFELFYPSPRNYLGHLYQQLGLGIVLPESLDFVENPPVIWHEANPELDRIVGFKADIGSSYFEKVVRPVLEKKRYEVPKPKIPDQALVSQYPSLKEAAIIYWNKAKEFYKRYLPQNKDFENFLDEYRKALEI